MRTSKLNTQTKKSKTRIHTVQSRWRVRRAGYYMVPELRLSGHWLKELGFEVGEKISVITKDKKIVIQAMGK